MTDKKTRARIKELADSAADDGHMMDAQQHLRRANECVLTANQLEQTLTEGVME